MQNRTFSLGRISAAAARHPWRVIVVWVLVMAAAAVFGGPKLWHVTTNDTSHFLPGRYESVRATQFGQTRFGQLQNATAVAALVTRSDGQLLTQANRAQARSAVAQMAAWRPDWSRLKVNGKHVNPTAVESTTRAVNPVVGPLAGQGADQLVSLQFKFARRARSNCAN
jgi:putative drug exporter of the RND superfamily